MLASAISPLMLVALGAAGLLAAGGFSVFPVVLLGIGGVLAAIVLFDFPLRATFGPEGLARRCALRRQLLDWDSVVGLKRARGSALSRTRRDVAASGALVASVGRRRNYLLVSHIESAVEYDEIVAGLQVWAPGVMVRAPRPPESVAPTWLYHRRPGAPGGDAAA